MAVGDGYQEDIGESQCLFMNQKTNKKAKRHVIMIKCFILRFKRVKQWKGEAAIMEPAKCDHLAWFPLESLPQNVVPHQRQVIQDQTDHCLYREIWEKN